MHLGVGVVTAVQQDSSFVFENVSTHQVTFVQEPSPQFVTWQGMTAEVTLHFDEGAYNPSYVEVRHVIPGDSK